MTINIDPVIVHIGGFALRWYGLTFAGGIVLGTFLVLREARRQGLEVEKVGNIALWAVVGGVAGARLFHVVDRIGYYRENPGQILMVNQGGLAIWGSLIIGGTVALLAGRRARLPTARLADAVPVGALVGQMVGRVGCLINGDAYGGPTGLPWGVTYVNPGAMVPESLRGVPTHPYPAYEIVWSLALLGLVLLLRRRTLPGGLVFLIYVAGYSVGRLGLTFVRQEASVLWGLQQAQLVALAVFLLAVIGTVLVTRTYGAARRAVPQS